MVAAAEAVGVSRRTDHKWLARFAAEGQAGLQDRSSRPHPSPKDAVWRRRRSASSSEDGSGSLCGALPRSLAAIWQL